MWPVNTRALEHKLTNWKKSEKDIEAVSKSSGETKKKQNKRHITT